MAANKVRWSVLIHIHSFIHSDVALQAVIFCNTKKKVDWLTAKMREANFTVPRPLQKGADRPTDAQLGGEVFCMVSIWGFIHKSFFGIKNSWQQAPLSHQAPMVLCSILLLGCDAPRTYFLAFFEF